MLRKLKRKLQGQLYPPAKASYSQSGEDILIDYVLGWMGIKTRTYLDIGAHHPHFLSNTYLFYANGFRGVTVEPDPSLHEVIEKARPQDRNLNVGVGGSTATSADFYIMKPTTLNTFSKKEANAYIEHYPDTIIERTVELPLTPLHKILDEHFSTCPDIISLDVEGLDFEIIKSLDFSKYRPAVWCIETVEYAANKSLRKSAKLLAYMLEQDYFVYADTFTNTVLIDKRAWQQKGMPQLKNLLQAS